MHAFTYPTTLLLLLIILLLIQSNLYLSLRLNFNGHINIMRVMYVYYLYKDIIIFYILLLNILYIIY